MTCPRCQKHDEDYVIETRDVVKFNYIRRRRKCKECDNKWTTFEVPTASHLDITDRLNEISKAVHASVAAKHHTLTGYCDRLVDLLAEMGQV